MKINSKDPDIKFVKAKGFYVPLERISEPAPPLYFRILLTLFMYSIPLLIVGLIAFLLL